MVQSGLLKFILEKANEVKNEFSSEFLCASHIVVAVADFCKTKYTGFSLTELNSTHFEEERLRYVFSKEVKIPSYFRMRLSRDTKKGVHEEAFDMDSCEMIASLRESKILTSDVVFLCALKALYQSHGAAFRSISTDDSIVVLLQDADKNIYDYVVDNIENIICELKKKANWAASIRDWKPALKFAEPDEVLAMFFKKIEKETSEQVMTLKLPKFFGTADLKISIHKVDGIYYIHDHGCAIKHLLKRVKDKQKCERIINKVCYSGWISKGRMTGSFISTFSFFEYLKMLVFVAHADLYYTKAKRFLCYKDKDYSFVEAEKAEILDARILLEKLKEGMGISYDENYGLYSWVDAKCSLSSGRTFFQIETFEGGQIRISDRKKGKYEGEIFEEFYWCNDDITPYSKFISKIVARFGAEFDGRDVYLIDKTGNFCTALFRFFNLAVVLYQFGHDIGLPKIRQKVKSNEC